MIRFSGRRLKIGYWLPGAQRRLLFFFNKDCWFVSSTRDVVVFHAGMEDKSNQRYLVVASGISVVTCAGWGCMKEKHNNRRVAFKILNNKRLNLRNGVLENLERLLVFQFRSMNIHFQQPRLPHSSINSQIIG